MTQRPTQLPADPAKYDAPRNVQARKRGLEQAYITGGDDPELGRTLAYERRYVRLLVGMVLVIVFGGFIIGFASAILGLSI